MKKTLILILLLTITGCVSVTPENVASVDNNNLCLAWSKGRAPAYINKEIEIRKLDCNTILASLNQAQVARQQTANQNYWNTYNAVRRAGGY